MLDYTNVFGDCPDVDSVVRATPDGWISELVGKWYFNAMDVDYYNQAFFGDCVVAEIKLEDGSNKNNVKEYVKMYNWLTLSYTSMLLHLECDPVSGKCAAWNDDDKDDKSEDAVKYLAMEKDVDPEFGIVYVCAPATIFWIIPIPFVST